MPLSYVSPYHENDIHSLNFLTPPPDLINNKDEYEIDQILKHCGPPKNHSYLIRWKGYNAEEDTWLKETKPGNAPEFLLSYKKGLKPPHKIPPSIATITLRKWLHDHS